MSISRKGANNLCQTFKNLEANKNEHRRLYPQEREEISFFYYSWKNSGRQIKQFGRDFIRKKMSSLFPMATKVIKIH